MKLTLEIAIEPGEDVRQVRAAANAWVDEVTGGRGWSRGEALVESLVKAGVNVSEDAPEVNVSVTE